MQRRGSRTLAVGSHSGWLPRLPEFTLKLKDPGNLTRAFIKSTCCAVGHRERCASRSLAPGPSQFATRRALRDLELLKTRLCKLNQSIGPTHDLLECFLLQLYHSSNLVFKITAPHPASAARRGSGNSAPAVNGLRAPGPYIATPCTLDPASPSRDSLGVQPIQFWLAKLMDEVVITTHEPRSRSPAGSARNTSCKASHRSSKPELAVVAPSLRITSIHIHKLPSWKHAGRCHDACCSPI